jgi:hypothetical protein
MKLAAPIRCRHCGRTVESPNDREFYSYHLTVTDPHTDQWSCRCCLTAQDKHDIVIELDRPVVNEEELPEVGPEDIGAATWEAGLVDQEVILLHQFVNISWRALRIAAARQTTD